VHDPLGWLDALGLACVKANKKAGDAFRDDIAKHLEGMGFDVAKEVTFKTALGARRVDILVSKGGRILGGIETKLGGSRYLPSQRAKDAMISLTEGISIVVVRGP